MKNLRIIFGIVLIMNGVGCEKTNATKPVSKKNTSPNIILILADDMGWTDCELYGSTYYETPNISRLASEGMYFTNAYAASPLCSPTRASIMSGQHPARLHLTQAITPRNVSEPKALPPKENQYCGEVQNKNHMPLEVFTLAEALKESGYRTAHIGKWHLTTSYSGWKEGDSTYNAEYQGFEFVIGGSHLPGPPDYYSPYKNRIRNLAPGPDGEYLNERLAEESIKWIKSVKDSDSPFYLNFWQYAVHGPWIAKKDLMPKYQAKNDPRGLHDCPEMGTMLESMDNSIGILLDWLDLPGNQSVKNNTIVLFASDNGGIVHEVNVSGTKRKVTSNRPLRGGKANTYEGGTRIPWIVRWPQHIAAGTVCNAPISTVDIYPTLVELTSTKTNTGQILDGLSIVPLLHGGSMEERPLFWDFPHHFGSLCASSTAVRKGDYKLIRFYWAGENAASHYYELFDLKKDQSEAVNLASYMPEKVKELDALISRHLQETATLVPIQNANFSGDPRKQRSEPAKSLIRPKSYHLAHDEFVVGSPKGSQLFQLHDQDGKPCKTAALVLEGSNWIYIDNLVDGQVQVSWNRSSKTDKAKILFGWNGGTTAHEMNDWTLDPFELVIR